MRITTKARLVGGAVALALSMTTVSGITVGLAQADEGDDNGCFQVSDIKPESLPAMLLSVAVGSQEELDAAVKAGVGNIYVASGGIDSLLGGDKKIKALTTPDGAPIGVSIDEEGGDVTRLKEVLGDFPSAVDQAKMDEEEMKQKVSERAKKMFEKGLTRDYAPVVDVGPADGILGSRTFSDDPEVVANKATVFAEGLASAQMGAVLKHFPGHGTASGDTHKVAAKTKPIEDLKKKDLVPYQKMIGSVPIDMVMVGHLDVPGFTDPGAPASLSPKVMKLLRDGKGYGAEPFDGVIVTDDLSDMKAASNLGSIGENVVRAIKAGADSAMIKAPDMKAALDALKGAKLDEKSMRESVDRITYMNCYVGDAE